ncbi:MAG: ABC transporter ATP-binding protein [Planctomycetota bacterium]
MLAVETRGLTKIYKGGVTGLADLDLEVETGEVVGLVGPNGSGKTTTIRLLLDLLRPTRGSCRIFSLDARRDSLEIRRRVGFLPGDLALYDGLTAHETLALSARLRRGAAPSLRESLLARLGVPSEALDRRVKTLSTGTRQKLGLLIALQHDPSLAILDEPTTGLDPLVRRRFHDAIVSWRGRGRTLLLCSHDIAEVALLCDRVCVLRDGAMVAQIPLEGGDAARRDGAALEERILSHYAAS